MKNGTKCSMVLAKINRTTLIAFYVQLLSRQSKSGRKEFIWVSVQNDNTANHLPEDENYWQF